MSALGDFHTVMARETLFPSTDCLPLEGSVEVRTSWSRLQGRALIFPNTYVDRGVALCKRPPSFIVPTVLFKTILDGTLLFIFYLYLPGSL